MLWCVYCVERYSIERRWETVTVEAEVRWCVYVCFYALNFIYVLNIHAFIRCKCIWVKRAPPLTNVNLGSLHVKYCYLGHFLDCNLVEFDKIQTRFFTKLGNLPENINFIPNSVNIWSGLDISKIQNFLNWISIIPEIWNPNFFKIWFG